MLFDVREVSMAASKCYEALDVPMASDSLVNQACLLMAKPLGIERLLFLLQHAMML